MKLSKISLCILFFGSVLAQEAIASDAIPNVQTSSVAELSSKASVIDTGTFQKGLMVSQDDVLLEQVSNSIVLTKEQKQQAKVWGLTEQEEQRYITVMQNKSGVFYHNKNLSPVWILGLNARSQNERMHFAKLAAQQEQQYIAQNLAWNDAYSHAYQELIQTLPIIRPFDFNQFSLWYEKNQ